MDKLKEKLSEYKNNLKKNIVVNFFKVNCQFSSTTL